MIKNASCITEDDRSVETETEVELELYEEIVGDLDYTTPVTNRPSRPLSYSEDRTTVNRHYFQRTHHYKYQREHSD